MTKLEDFDAAAVKKRGSSNGQDIAPAVNAGSTPAPLTQEPPKDESFFGEGERCAGCGHRILPGGRVFRSEDGKVYHDGDPWRCATRM